MKNKKNPGLTTLIDVKFNNDMLDHQLEIDMSPLSMNGEDEIISWIAFFQHAFDTRRRSGRIPERQRRRIHLVSQILAAATAEHSDDTVADTLNYADFLLIARAHSQTEELSLKEMDKMVKGMFGNEESAEEDRTDYDQYLEDRVTALNKEFDEKMVKVIADKLTLEDNNPSIYKK